MAVYESCIIIIIIITIIKLLGLVMPHLLREPNIEYTTDLMHINCSRNIWP